MTSCGRYGVPQNFSQVSEYNKAFYAAEGQQYDNHKKYAQLYQLNRETLMPAGWDDAEYRASYQGKNAHAEDVGQSDWYKYAPG